MTDDATSPDTTLGSAAAKESLLKGKKLVIVEDDSFLHNLLADKMEWLREKGVEIYPTFNGEEALTTSRKILPDIMLLDLMLPEMNGFEILKTVRNDPNLKKTPVVILSNLGEDSDREKANQLGVTDYMVKSNFTLEELVERVISILEKN